MAHFGQFVYEHRCQQTAKIRQLEDAKVELARLNDRSPVLCACKRQQRVRIDATLRGSNFTSAGSAHAINEHE